MKTCLLIFLVGCTINRSFSQSAIDVLHYKFEIQLSDNNDTIAGKATITAVMLSRDKEFALDLIARYKEKKGMLASVYGLNVKDTFFSRQSENKLYIRPLHVTPGDTLHFVVSYKGIPTDGLIISKNKYGDRTFFADNWPDRAHHWIPCIDHPADKASFEFLVTAPAQYAVVSNGIKVEEKMISETRKLTHWKEDIPLSTKIMVIGVAKFATKEYPDSPAGVPVSAWVYPRDSTQGFKNYSAAPEIIKFFASYVAPFPFKKLANVQSTTIYGGMENAGAIFYHENSATAIDGAESLVAHEIAHQWFGDMVSEKSFPHLWLSEGFATYLEHLYKEWKYGHEKFIEQMKLEREQVISFSKESGKPVVDSLSPVKSLLNANSYQKGSWVLHMLRCQLGDTVFQKIIQQFYETFEGKNADTRDFQMVAEKISGKKLEQFFDQWLYSPLIPDLSILWSYSAAKKTIYVTIRQNQTLFSFPLDILITDKSGKPIIKKLSISKKEEKFSFPLLAKPSSIEADPFTSLLFSGIIREIRN
jgi:aminopeptidase N